MAEHKSKLNLIESRPKRISAEVFSRYSAGLLKREDKLEVKSTLNKSTRRLDVCFKFSTTVFNKIEGNESRLALIDIEFLGSFEWAEDAVYEDVLSFAKLNGPAIIYPLLRSTLSTQSVSMGIPPIILNIVNFNKMDVAVIEEDLQYVKMLIR